MGTLDAALGLRFLLGKRLRRTFFGPFTWLAMPIIALFLRLVIRRSTVSDADRQTAATFDNGAALARALTKLDSYAKTLPIDASLAEAALFTVDPLNRHDFSTWTSAAPTIEFRVRRLTGRFPL
jgi:Zn-dependent protease with chaperone function